MNYICNMNNSAFIFDYVHVVPDRQIGLHSHTKWELSHVILGEGLRTIGDMTEPITEGEVILIPPSIPHVWNFNPDTTDSNGCITNVTLLFENHTLEELATILPELKECVDKILSQKDALSYSSEVSDKIAAILYSMRVESDAKRIPHIMELLTIIADTGSTREVGHNNVRNRIMQRLENIRTFCSCNHMRDISLDEIAALIGMNKSAFCTFMKRQTGKTFSEYRNNVRLQHAVERIKFSDDNISDIAYSVGFANVTYFNRLFRAKYGCTPKSMRDELHFKNYCRKFALTNNRLQHDCP